MSSEGSDASKKIQNEIEDESHENITYEFTDFVRYDSVDVGSGTEIEFHFEEPIADEAWLENYELGLSRKDK